VQTIRIDFRMAPSLRTTSAPLSTMSASWWPRASSTTCSVRLAALATSTTWSRCSRPRWLEVSYLNLFTYLILLFKAKVPVVISPLYCDHSGGGRKSARSGILKFAIYGIHLIFY